MPQQVHIALVGKQISPVLSVINYLKPDMVILVHSAESEKEAEQIKNNVSSAEEFSDTKIDFKVCKCDPTDIEDIKLKFTGMLSIFEDQYLTVNIASGTKVWSYYAQKIFGEAQGTEMFYIDQKNDLWNLTNETKENVDAFIPEMCRHQGVSINAYNDEDVETMQNIEKLRLYDFKAFNELTVIQRGPTPSARSGLNRTDKSLVSWLYYDGEKKEIQAHFERKNKKALDVDLHSPKMWELLFNSGWFEFKIAKMVQGWDKAENIMLNNKFSTTANFQKPDNEIDIIFEAEGRQYYVEVKTQVFDTTDVDKFSTVADRNGGHPIKIFVTDAKMDSRAKSKCDSEHIPTFSLDEHRGSNLQLDFIAFLEKQLTKHEL